MNQEQWEKVQELFERALEFSKEDRIPFIKKQCEGEKDLFEEVVSLLEADDNVHPVLDRKASEIINIEEKLNFVGQIIGNYKLVEEIASGGMGTVFLAERCDGVFEQKVALKIIKPGLSTIPIIRRFQNERQILANLQHTNIARLFDGGVTDDRRPFFTMEYVEGTPIDEYCDQNKLTINERLNLFIKVCETVQFAHNNLVIHRDLKPNNILIKEDGSIKLLDFGISKVLSADGENVDIPTITQAEINLLTPEYSSPEQIKNSKISVSTDVYSLGIILYKLLSGKNGHDFKSRTFNEFERVVCEQNLLKPSVALFNQNENDDENQILNYCYNRKTTPNKLRKLLSGDLDNICMMALRKEPERRYPSVEMLAYDIERYINNIPILARKDSYVYSSRKFILRHRAVVTTAIALFFIVNGLILYYTIQLRAERDKANLEARKSEQVASFLQELFLVSDPSESKGESITARELLDRGATQIKGGLDEEPEIKAQLLNTIGRVYTNLGLFKSAKDIFLKIKNHPKSVQINNETLIESLISLGSLYRLNGEYELAGEIILKTLDECKEIFGDEHHLVGDCYLNLGGYYYETGDYKKSYLNYNKAEKIFRKNYGNKNEKVAAVINALGVLSYEDNHLNNADSLYRESIKIVIGLKGEINQSVAEYQNQLAQVLRHQGKYSEAQILYEKALSTRKKLFGNEHPDVAASLNHLSRLYYNQEMFDEAEPLAREALKIRLSVFAEDHPEVSASRSSLAGVLFYKKKFKEAENLYREAYNASFNKLGESHPYTPAIQGNLGRTLFELGNYVEAEKHLLRSFSLLKEIFNFDHKYIISRVNWISELLIETGRFNEAEKLLREQLDSLKGNPSENNWMIGEIKSLLGYSLFKQSKDLEAEGMLIHGFNIIIEKKDKNNLEAKKARNRIVEYYSSKGREDKIKDFTSKL